MSPRHTRRGKGGRHLSPKQDLAGAFGTAWLDDSMHSAKNAAAAKSGAASSREDEGLTAEDGALSPRAKSRGGESGAAFSMLSAKEYEEYQVMLQDPDYPAFLKQQHR